MIKYLFLALLISGCISQPETQVPPEETTVLDVEPVIDYYILGGYTEATDEAFYVIAGDVTEAKSTLSSILMQEALPENTFHAGDDLNFVVFRGVFSTGGYGITIERLEKTGNAFVTYATYTYPGRGMFVTQAFTQPTAIIPIGRLPEGEYGAKLMVTTISQDEGGVRVIEEENEHASVSFVVE